MLLYDMLGLIYKSMRKDDFDEEDMRKQLDDFTEEVSILEKPKSKNQRYYTS